MHWIFRSPKPEKVIELMGKYQIPEIIAKLKDKFPKKKPSIFKKIDELKN